MLTTTDICWKTFVLLYYLNAQWLLRLMLWSSEGWFNQRLRWIPCIVAKPLKFFTRERSIYNNCSSLLSAYHLHYHLIQPSEMSCEIYDMETDVQRSQVTSLGSQKKRWLSQNWTDLRTVESMLLPTLRCSHAMPGRICVWVTLQRDQNISENWDYL